MNYRLRHYPYSGGHIDLIDEGDLATCRRRAYGRITSHRNVMEYPVTILERGSRWELETGDEAAMIGDGEGIMAIEEIAEVGNHDDLEEPLDACDEVMPDLCERCHEPLDEDTRDDCETGLCEDCSEGDNYDDLEDEE